MDTFQYHIIGKIHSPFTDPRKMPIQPVGATGSRGHVVLNPAYREGLKDLDGFSHIFLLYHFHRTQKSQLTIKPFLDETPRGIFATRAPVRPNPIGLSVVQLERIEDNILYVCNIDVLDGTPLLDIKPFVPEFDQPENTRIGWLRERIKGASDIRSDDRFH
jgi:tRNA-Thr(GGU) m(6)t(6)A37 methyltransferase TsaA